MNTEKRNGLLQYPKNDGKFDFACSECRKVLLADATEKQGYFGGLHVLTEHLNESPQCKVAPNS